jgi:lysylphosphatidylglycerol synthetase-like protein (DUF2156 family)
MTYSVLSGRRCLLTQPAQAKLTIAVLVLSTLFYIWADTLVEAVLLFALCLAVVLGLEKGPVYKEGKRQRLLAFTVLAAVVIYLYIGEVSFVLTVLGAVGLVLLFVVSLPSRVQRKITAMLFRLEERVTETAKEG